MTAHMEPGTEDCSEPQAVSSIPLSAEELLQREVEFLLRGSSHCELRQVTCRFADGVATLSGQVSSYYLKAIAQTIVRNHPAVTRVINRLHVTDRQSNASNW